MPRPSLPFLHLRLLSRRALLLPLAVMVSAIGCGEELTAPGSLESTPLFTETSTSLVFRQVSAGSSQTCGVTTTYRAYCWGGGALRPVPVSGGRQYLQVSVGHNRICGITTTNQAYCWGDNSYGGLGNGTTVSSSTPVAVAGGHKFRQVSVGADHTCAVNLWNVAFCWGRNREGQSGTTEFSRTTPTRVIGGLLFRQVIAGGFHTCGTTTTGRAYCWGLNQYGQLGTGLEGWVQSSSKPLPVVGGLEFRMVAAGGGVHLRTADEYEGGVSCGLTTSDLVYCWGETPMGPIISTPIAVQGGHRFRDINVSHQHACGATLTNEAFCWGVNQSGQIGDGTATVLSRYNPTKVAGGLPFKWVTTNTYSEHSCGITTVGKAYCWGANGHGQIGDGTRSASRPSPIPVLGPL